MNKSIMEAVERLSNLQKQGYEILSTIQKDYNQKRRSNSFDRVNDIAIYQKEYYNWGKQVFIELLENGSLPYEASKFNNAPIINITYSSGENIAFGNIKNRFQDKISVLNNIIEKLKTNIDQPLSKKGFIINHLIEIQESLNYFRKDHPEPDKVGFVIMQFGSTKLHEQILEAIRDTLSKHGLIALRADDNKYHDDLYYNTMTYMFGCGFGIAVYEHIETTEFNPNVSLEVGGMLVLGKSVCLLKEKTIETLQTDLIGKLYCTFDTEDLKETISTELSRWLSDKELGII